MILLRKVKIKDLGKVFTGSTPPTKDEKMWGGKHLFVKPSDLIKGSRRVFDTETKLSDGATQTSKGRLLPVGTTCVVTIGTIGKLCQLDKPSATNQQINSIVVDKQKYDQDYVYYLMTQSINRVKVVEGGSASGREHVKKSTFEEIELEVLPLAEQVKVSHLVKKYDNLIENNNRRIAILEDMAQSLYREWFVNFRYPVHADNVDASSPKALIESKGKPKLIDSPLGQIPEGWEVKVFSESFDFWNGKKCTKSEQGEFELYGANGIVGKAEAWKYENAVIIGRVGAYCGAVEYCFDRFWGSDNTIIAKCKTDTNISYLFLLLEHFNLNKYAGGSAQPLLTQTTLKQLKYIAPPEELINEFEKITHKFYEVVVNLKKRNQNLKKQRDMLLPKLISGQIELKD